VSSKAIKDADARRCDDQCGFSLQRGVGNRDVRTKVDGVKIPLIGFAGTTFKLRYIAVDLGPVNCRQFKRFPYSSTARPSSQRMSRQMIRKTDYSLRSQSALSFYVVVVRLVLTTFLPHHQNSLTYAIQRAMGFDTPVTLSRRPNRLPREC